MTGHSWGYGQKAGPSEWYKSYPIAQGSYQSPVDIIPTKAIYDPCLKPLSILYESCSSLDISNNGHSVMVDFKDVDDKTGTCCQWGATGRFLQAEAVPFPLGGQAKILGQNIPLMANLFLVRENTTSLLNLYIIMMDNSPPQLHLVHWNAKKYMSFGEAMAAPDGLAVVGVFLEIGEEHAYMNRLTDALYMVKFKGTKTQFKHFSPSRLLPPCLDYWTYPGSLTTPPLHESVTWMVLKDPIRISDKQMEKFRTLLFTTEEDERVQMVNNFRPPQPLKGRVVRASFKA
ncbi:Carbonic anhydrase 7 [Varanus komodoensis]|nr:Carbonic anhydrase 7 [Varanus komodoensis]